MKKVLLSIAGYDPTSGAGVLLDLNVFNHLGFQGVGIITSLAVQNTKNVKKTHSLPPTLLWDQYQCLREDVSFSGIKVGMIGSENNIPFLEKILSENPHIPKILDPVFKSSSGTWLLEKKAPSRYIKSIAGKASLLTPNLDEAALISGIKVKRMEDMKEAAVRIYNQTGISCLIKGGHLQKITVDLLYDGNDFLFFKKEKLKKNVHGTGCFLSSTILGYLVKGKSLKRACHLATKLTFEAIKSAVPVGQGQEIITFPRYLKSS